MYSPEIRVHISTRNNGIVDISPDLVQGSLTIRTNGIHTFNFQLQNAQRKYDRVIQPMDRITIEMKRVTWVRVFSGYLNNGPVFSAWPRVLTLMASCTLKRLQFWWWDPTTSAVSKLLDSTLGSGRQTPAAATTSTQAGGVAPAPTPQGSPTGQVNFDSAVSQTVVNILTKVVAWPQEKIHIAAIPGNWTSVATAFGQKVLATNDMSSMFGDFSSTAGLDAVISGNGLAANAQGAGAGGAAASAPGATGGAAGGVIAGKPTSNPAPSPPGTYGGTRLNQTQVNNSALINSVVAKRGLPQKAAVIANAVALQESSLTNLAGGDRDSAGLFQQRPSAGWGTYAQVTDPVHATNSFLDGLLKVPGWQNLSVTAAAQAVQRSAFPNAYARWAPTAAALAQGVNPNGAAGGSLAGGVFAAAQDAAAQAAAAAQAVAQAVATAEPIARGVDNSLLNIYTWGLQPSQLYGDLLGGARAMMNDQPMLPYLANLMAACMRSWCSAPNGDFIAWFPDYFGIWNSAAVMNIEPIELMDFTVEWNDQEIVTHQYVVGTPFAMINAETAQAQGAADSSGMNWMLSTSGIATIDTPGIFALIFGHDPGSAFAADYLRRFGGRSSLLTMPLITQGLPEFIMAIYLLMQRWANQFIANVPMTFMPELWPGMLLRIPAYNFQAYITEVTHSFQFGKGGGFYTSAKICAPARTSDDNVSSVFGLLPLAGGSTKSGSSTTSGATGAGKSPTSGGTAFNDIPAPS